DFIQLLLFSSFLRYRILIPLNKRCISARKCISVSVHSLGVTCPDTERTSYDTANKDEDDTSYRCPALLDQNIDAKRDQKRDQLRQYAVEQALDIDLCVTNDQTNCR